jgi:hypothetical protein
MFSKWWKARFAWMMTTVPIWGAIYLLTDGESVPVWDWRAFVFSVVWVGLGVLTIWKLRIWPFGPADD